MVIGGGYRCCFICFTVFCFTRQPDHFAAFTVLPIWVWGGVGLLLAIISCYLLRASVAHGS